MWICINVIFNLTFIAFFLGMQVGKVWNLILVIYFLDKYGKKKREYSKVFVFPD